jgi:hypothetical protein
MIRIDYTQLGIPNHMTYVGLQPTYINLHSNPLKHDRVQRHPRAQYTSNPALATRVHTTLAISALPVRGWMFM